MKLTPHFEKKDVDESFTAIETLGGEIRPFQVCFKSIIIFASYKICLLHSTPVKAVTTPENIPHFLQILKIPKVAKLNSSKEEDNDYDLSCAVFTE